MGRNGGNFLQLHQACEMGTALRVNLALDQNLAMHNVDCGERVKLVYRYVCEEKEAGKNELFTFYQLDE